MPDCSSIDSLVTPYVDGELTGVTRDALERHVRACPPCYSRVAAEKAVRELLRARQASFRGECASAVLHATCLRHGAQGRSTTLAVGLVTSGSAPRWRRRAAPLAAAAALLLVVGGVLLYQATESSSRVIAAELAADHLKCFTLNAVLGTHQSAAMVEQAMASGFGWEVHLPNGIEREGLELVGARPCLYGGGKVAHIMYRHNGEPVSLFMLPKTTQTEQVVEALGHECAIWSADDRTFVLVARETRREVERLAAFAHAAFH